MKLHASGATAYNTFTAYGADYVTVNGQRHQASVIVLPDAILAWDVPAFDALSEQSFSVLENRGLEIVLLGTGETQRFPHPRLTASLAKAGIGVEVMNLQAACRTYNILMAEERKVAAALLFK